MYKATCEQTCGDCIPSAYVLSEEKGGEGN